VLWWRSSICVNRCTQLCIDWGVLAGELLWVEEQSSIIQLTSAQLMIPAIFQLVEVYIPDAFLKCEEEGKKLTVEVRPTSIWLGCCCQNSMIRERSQISSLSYYI
jgi:hypothetical protein